MLSALVEKFVLRRPLALAVCTVLSTLTVAFFFGVKTAGIAAVCVCLVCVGLAILSAKSVEKNNALHISAIVLFFTVIGFFTACYMIFSDNGFKSMYSNSIGHTVQGIVVGESYKNNEKTFTVRIKNIDGRREHRTASFENLSDFVITAGDDITLTAIIECEGKNVIEEITLYSVELSGISHDSYSVYVILSKLKAYMTETLRCSISGDEGELTVALVTGEKGNVDSKIITAFRRCGLSHTLVISGLHISTLLTALYYIMNKLKFPNVISLFMMFASAFFAVMLYSFTPSIIRAALMCCITFGSKAALISHDSAVSLSLAAFVILCINPRYVVSASFWLSFVCCFAITVVYPYLVEIIDIDEKIENYRIRRYVKILLMSTTITVVTIPVLTAFGMSLSIISPIVNIIIVPLIELLLGLSIITLLITAIFSAASISIFAAGLTRSVASAVIACAKFFSSFRLSCVALDTDFLKYWIVISIFLLLMSVIVKNKIFTYAVTASLIISLTVCIAVNRSLKSDRIIVFGGQSAVVISHKETAAIIAGNDYNISLAGNYINEHWYSKPNNIIYCEPLVDSMIETVVSAFPESNAIIPGQTVSVGNIVISVDVDGTTLLRKDSQSIALIGSSDFKGKCNLMFCTRYCGEIPFWNKYDICVCSSEIGKNGREICYNYNDTVEISFDKYIKVKIK